MLPKPHIQSAVRALSLAPVYCLAGFLLQGCLIDSGKADGPVALHLRTDSTDAADCDSIVLEVFATGDTGTSPERLVIRPDSVPKAYTLWPKSAIADRFSVRYTYYRDGAPIRMLYQAFGPGAASHPVALDPPRPILFAGSWRGSTVQGFPVFLRIDTANRIDSVDVEYRLQGDICTLSGGMSTRTGSGAAFFVKGSKAAFPVASNPVSYAMVVEFLSMDAATGTFDFSFEGNDPNRPVCRGAERIVFNLAREPPLQGN